MNRKNELPQEPPKQEKVFHDLIETERLGSMTVREVCKSYMEKWSQDGEQLSVCSLNVKPDSKDTIAGQRKTDKPDSL